MLRQVLIELALFLTPFAVYAALLFATRGTLVPESWSARTLALLSAAAVGLVVLGLVVFEMRSVAPVGARYVPAHTAEDGTFVPGHFE